MADRGFAVLRSPISAQEVDLSIEGFAGPEQHQYSKEMNVLLYAPRSGSEGSNEHAADQASSEPNRD
jgi:hypothetical protein